MKQKSQKPSLPPLSKNERKKAGSNPEYFFLISKYAEIIRIPVISKYFLVNNKSLIDTILEDKDKKFCAPTSLYKRKKAITSPMPFSKNDNVNFDLLNKIYNEFNHSKNKEEKLKEWTRDQFEIFEISSKNHLSININNEARSIALKTLNELAFGLNLSDAHMVDQISHYLDACQFYATKIPLPNMPLPTISYYTFLSYRIILTTKLKKAWRKSDYKSPIFKNSKKFPAKFLKNQLINSIERISCAISWCCYHLTQHPEWQEKLLDNDKKLLDCFVKECLRLSPPSWLICRKNKNELKLGKFTIPGNSNVVISPYSIHRSKKNWENPLKFDPNRFGNNPNIEKNTYLPFGYEEKNNTDEHFDEYFAWSVISFTIQEIVNRFRITEDKLHSNRMHSGFTLNTAEGIRVIFDKRKN